MTYMHRLEHCCPLRFVCSCCALTLLPPCLNMLYVASLLDDKCHMAKTITDGPGDMESTITHVSEAIKYCTTPAKPPIRPHEWTQDR
jgi:hypothetical protein